MRFKVIFYEFTKEELMPTGSATEVKYRQILDAANLTRKYRVEKVFIEKTCTSKDITHFLS